MFVSNYRFKFFHQSLNQELYICLGKRFKTKLFRTLFRISEVGVFQNVVLILIYPAYQPLFSRCLRCWFLPSKSQSKARNLYRGILSKNKSISSLVQKFEGRNIPELASSTDLSPHVNSSFNITKNLMSSTKVSIENITLLKVEMIAKSFTLSFASASW